MAATAAVLDTYELLEAIIAFLPRDEIRSAAHVAKSWRTTVNRSKVICEARCLVPLFTPIKAYELHFPSLNEEEQQDEHVGGEDSSNEEDKCVTVSGPDPSHRPRYETKMVKIHPMCLWDNRPADMNSSDTCPCEGCDKWGPYAGRKQTWNSLDISEAFGGS